MAIKQKRFQISKRKKEIQKTQSNIKVTHTEPMKSAVL